MEAYQQFPALSKAGSHKRYAAQTSKKRLLFVLGTLLLSVVLLAATGPKLFGVTVIFLFHCRIRPRSRNDPLNNALVFVYVSPTDEHHRSRRPPFTQARHHPDGHRSFGERERWPDPGERQMIRITTEHGKTTCVAELGDRVAVYLDNDAISELARPGDLRKRFVVAILKRGTLLFSSANAIEVSTSDNVCSFLDEIGPQWVPLGLDPWELVKAEQSGAGPSAPISQILIESYFLERAYELSPNGSRLVDLSADTFFRLGAVARWVKRDSETARLFKALDEGFRGLIAAGRAAFEINPSRLDQMWPPIPFDPNQPGTFVLRHLLRMLVHEAKAYQLGPHDVRDLCHAVVAASYGQLVTLDKQWKRRVEGLPKPNQLATVYYRPQVGKLVERLEALVGSSPR